MWTKQDEKQLAELINRKHRHESYKEVLGIGIKLNLAIQEYPEYLHGLTYDVISDFYCNIPNVKISMTLMGKAAEVFLKHDSIKKT